MRAALMTAPGQPLELVEDVELESPRAGEVKVQLHNCGLCHSDLHFIDGSLPGPTPLLLGHEAGGIVTDVGAGVLDLAEGDKVILTLRPPCGRCFHCVRGEMSLCETYAGGLFPDGGTRLSRGGDVVHRSGVNLAAFADGLDVSESDVLLYLALREAAHQRLFAHVPWLRDHLIQAVADYAAGIEIDTGELTGAEPRQFGGARLLVGSQPPS